MKDMNDFFLKKTTTGQIIKAFRSNFKITQKEIATAIGINESNMSAIENDRREIGVDLSSRIGAFLGINPSLLLFPNGEQEALNKHKKIISKAAKIRKQKLQDAS